MTTSRQERGAETTSVAWSRGSLTRGQLILQEVRVARCPGSSGTARVPGTPFSAPWFNQSHGRKLPVFPPDFISWSLPTFHLLSLNTFLGSVFIDAE